MTEQPSDTERMDDYSLSGGELYDAIYSSKDYEAEAKYVTQIVDQRLKSGDRHMLEAACGTGTFTELFGDTFQVDGFDFSEPQVVLARQKLPDSNIFTADMTQYVAEEPYDVVVCLFSSIGHVLTVESMRKTIANFERSTKPGGVIIVEPWLKPEEFIENHISMENAETDTLKVQRMGRSRRVEGNITAVDFWWQAGNSNGVRQFRETIKAGMFTVDEIQQAFTDVGLKFEWDDEGLIGRGLAIGTKPN